MTAIEATEFVKGHVVSIKLGSIEEIKKDADNSKFGNAASLQGEIEFLSNDQTSYKLPISIGK